MRAYTACAHSQVRCFPRVRTPFHRCSCGDRGTIAEEPAPDIGYGRIGLYAPDERTSLELHASNRARRALTFGHIRVGRLETFTSTSTEKQNKFD
jgi:hypothetical protein